MNGESDRYELAKESTLSYYEGSAVEYAERTLGADLASIYDQFLELVPRGARILDAGCGAGRDLKAFLSKGYKPFGIDASQALADMAHKYSRAPTQVRRIEDIEFDREFDGVWACASLLHLPKNMMPCALSKLNRALVDGGIIYISVQVGDEEGLGADGRFFARYQDWELAELLEKSNFRVLSSWLSADTLSGRDELTWENVLARKSS